ncbi:MAG: hypothetical protein V1809_08370 [Planctomycetota bacterium]
MGGGGAGAPPSKLSPSEKTDEIPNAELTRRSTIIGIGDKIPDGIRPMNHNTRLSFSRWFFLIIPMVVASCQTTETGSGLHPQDTTWKTKQIKFLKVEMPDGWDVQPYIYNNKNHGYLLVDDKQQNIGHIGFYVGGPEYVDCFCLRKEDYGYREADGMKIWSAYTPFKGESFLSSKKIAKGDCRLIWHMSFPKETNIHGNVLNRIVESMRLVDVDRYHAPSRPASEPIEPLPWHVRKWDNPLESAPVNETPNPSKPFPPLEKLPPLTPEE